MTKIYGKMLSIFLTTTTVPPPKAERPEPYPRETEIGPVCRWVELRAITGNMSVAFSEAAVILHCNWSCIVIWPCERSYVVIRPLLCHSGVVVMNELCVPWLREADKAVVRHWHSWVRSVCCDCEQVGSGIVRMYTLRADEWASSIPANCSVLRVRFSRAHHYSGANRYLKFGN